MDIQLDGGISGVAAAAAIRGHLDIPVVFLTAHASAETVTRAVESGAFGYLLKPYTVPELKAAIEIGLHKHTTESPRCAMRSVRAWRLIVALAQSASEQHKRGGSYLQSSRFGAQMLPEDAVPPGRLFSSIVGLIFVNQAG